MEPEGLGILSGLVTALSGLTGVADTAPPPEPAIPQPGGAVIELRVSGQEYIIPPDHILAVLAGVDENMGSPQLDLTLDAQAAALFAEITTTHQGRAMDLVVCDRVLMSPVIQEPIVGGRIVVSGGFTREEVENIAGQITGSLPCDPAVETK